MVNEIFEKVVKDSNRGIKAILCHNFTYIGGENYSAGEGNSLFVIILEKKVNWIKIIHKIDSNADGGHRMKLYYANSPENEFCEIQSSELGFMDGENYSYILRLKNGKYDSLRFDLGFKPIGLKFQHFIIAKPSIFEILTKTVKAYFGKIHIIIRYLKNNKIGLLSILRKVLKSGIKETLKSTKILTSNVLGEAECNKSTVQVVEPYRVQVKKELHPERKKVLHFIENFYTGGSSRLIIDIIEHYGHIYDHKILTMAYRGTDEFLNIDVEVVDINDKKSTLDIINQFCPDIIHVHIWEGEWYEKVFDLLANIECKIIQNINTPVKPIVRDYVDKYVFVSKYVLENFHDVSDNKSLVIYPGSNFDMFTRQLEGDYLAKDTIGMVYRLGYDKLNQHSIDVFIKTVQKRPQTKVIIVGGGPQYEYYVNKVKGAGLLKNFIFTGYVPYIELPSWYEKFTVFVAPVWKESFGQVSPFAMSMGIPVAGYDIGALNEIIDNESLLAPSDNSDKLSDIIVKLLDNYDECKDIGKLNQKRAWSRFGVKTMVDDYNKLYNELIR